MRIAILGSVDDPQVDRVSAECRALGVTPVVIDGDEVGRKRRLASVDLRRGIPFPKSGVSTFTGAC